MPVSTLHITNAWHGSSGGIRTFYQALLDGANRDQRFVTLVVPARRASVEPIGRFGRIYFVAAPAAPLFDRRYRLIYPYAYWPALGGAVADILRNQRPDVVEIADKYSLPYLAGMLRRNWFRGLPRPALVGLSCERFDDNMAAYLSTRPAARMFTRWYIRHIYGPPFDAHVANSDYTASELRDAMPERPRDFIRVCPVGVDAHGFSPDRWTPTRRRELIARAQGDGGSTLLLYAGRLSPEKNLGLLVETLRTLVEDDRESDFRLIVAGDGPRAAWLAGQATGLLAGRIVLLGNLDPATLAECYATCDVFVHPNPREPFGIGPLEAMASGLPVVLPDRGGVLTYATSANAWLAAPEPLAFARAVRQALEGSPTRMQAARETALRFGWDEVTRRYFSLYDEIHATVITGTAGRIDTRPTVPAGGAVPLG